MDKVARMFRKPLKLISYLSIIVGFCGMGFIFYWLIRGTFSLLFVDGAMPAVAPVLPGIKVPGLPQLGFWHWIVAIFIVAIIHEMSHGVFARVYNIQLKSSGFAFLGPILAAFVEPDENVMKRRRAHEQLSILSAGPFSNILLAIVFLLIGSFLFPQVYNFFYIGSGVEVNNLIMDMPMKATGIESPFMIKSINNIEILDVKSFLYATDKIKPNEKIKIGTDKGVYEVTTVTNPENSSKGYIGISDFVFKFKVKEKLQNYKWAASVVSWVNVLIIWLFVVNLGIGLFNLLPLGPVDGGRMFQVAALKIIKNKKKAIGIWSMVSKFCLLLIFFNLIPYLVKLLNFIAKLIL